MRRELILGLSALALVGCANMLGQSGVNNPAGQQRQLTAADWQQQAIAAMLTQYSAAVGAQLDYMNRGTPSKAATAAMENSRKEAYAAIQAARQQPESGSLRATASAKLQAYSNVVTSRTGDPLNGRAVERFNSAGKPELME